MVRPRSPQGLVEDGRVLGVLIPDLGTHEAGEGHLAHALLEGDLAPELGKVVVGPAYGGYREPDVLSAHVILLDQYFLAFSTLSETSFAAAATSAFSDTTAVPTRHHES